MHYSRPDGTYVPVTDVADQINPPATVAEEVAEDPRLRATYSDQVAQDPRMRPVPGAPGSFAPGFAAAAGIPQGFGYGYQPMAAPAMQFMAPQLAFGQHNEFNMQPMMPAAMMHPSFVPMNPPFSEASFPPRGRQMHYGPQGQGRSKSPAARARSLERKRKHVEERMKRAGSLPPPARDVRPVDAPFKPTPKELLPPRRSVGARQRAAEKPGGPPCFNRNPARDVRPAPVRQPDVPPRMQLMSDAELVKEFAHVRKKGAEAEAERVEKFEESRRQQFASVAEAMRKKSKDVPLRATASGPATMSPRAGVPVAEATRVESTSSSEEEDSPRQKQYRQRKAHEARSAAEVERKRKKAVSTAKSRANYSSMNDRVKVLEKVLFGYAGADKNERQMSSAHALVRCPHSREPSPERMTKEQFFGLSDGDSLSDSESESDANWKHSKAASKQRIACLMPTHCSLSQCKCVPLQTRAMSYAVIRGRLRWCNLISAHAKAKDPDCGMRVDVDVDEEQPFFVKSSSIYIPPTEVWVVRARVKSPNKITTKHIVAQAKRARNKVTTNQIVGAKSKWPRADVATLMTWAALSLVPPIVWFIAAKLLNKLAHAANGNTSPRSIVKKIHLDGAPVLVGESIHIEKFLLWTIDLKAYCEMNGLTKYIIGPEPTAPTEDALKSTHEERLAEGLRYLCAMCEDPNLKASIALNANGKGTEGYQYLVQEFLQNQPVQSRYLRMLQGMALNGSESVVLFRNKWQKVVTQLDPKPVDTILCEMFAHAVSVNTGSFYDTCLDQNISRNDYKTYTQTLTQLCQQRKDRLDEKAKGDGEGIAGGNSAQAMKAMVAREVRQALDQRPRQRSTREKANVNANKAFQPNKKRTEKRVEDRDPCIRCGKRGHNRKQCTEPIKKCTFRFPDGEVCGGDHAEQFCWGRHPELCKLPRVKKAILRRLGKTANQTSIEEDSDDEEESGAWGDACGHCIKVIHPNVESEEAKTHDITAISIEAHDSLIEYPVLHDATEGIIDLTCLLSGGYKNEMFVDTGASDHIVVDSRCVVRPELHRPSKVRIKTGNSVSCITSIGPVSYNVKTEAGDMYMITRRALYANEKETGFNVNLWSVPLDFDVHGSVTTFDPANNILFADGTVVPFERDTQRRYILKYFPMEEELPCQPRAHGAFTDRAGTITPAQKGVPPMNPVLHLWHRRLGHCSLKTIMRIPNHVVGIPPLAWTQVEAQAYMRNCEICPMARLKSAPHKNNRVEVKEAAVLKERDKMRTTFGECVLMDMAGPLSPSMNKGYRYTSLFVDDGTDNAWVYFACMKSDQKNLHKRFCADTARYGEVKEYHSDNGGEYVDKEYSNLILDEGAAHTFSVPYTPNNNNKAENTLWRIFCIARALLFEAGLPPVHWPFAIQHAMYLLNRIPIRRIIAGEVTWRTPYYALNKRLPSSRHLKVWGSRCSVETLKRQRLKADDPKFSPRAEIGYYMGRSTSRKAYIVFIPKTDCKTLDKGEYVERRTLVFHEDKTPRILREQGTEDVAPPPPERAGSDGSESEDGNPPAPIPTPAEAPAARQGRRLCGRPGCTLPDFHDGACSFERDLASGGRPSDNLRRRNAPIAGVDGNAQSRSAQPRGLATGVESKNQSKTAEFMLGSGTKLVWADKASKFDLKDALYATNVLDNEDIAEAIKTDNGDLLQALIAKQKMFRNEGDGTFQTLSVPKTLREILKLPKDEQLKWVTSMWDELKSHLENGTWILVPVSNVPGKRRMVGSTWAFDIKRDANGVICRWKSRLCAQGFTQEEGVDYFETYSNTIRYETLRLVLALAAMNNLELSSIDIKTAYLNGSIEAELEIYMTPPRGFTFNMDKECPAGKAEFNGTNEPDRKYACLLKRSIYGLKQSGRRWEIRFWEFLRTLNAVQCEIDPCLWKIKEGGNFLLIAIYVDDVVFATNSPPFRDEVVRKLKEAFQVVDQGPLTWIFGTAIKQDLRKGIVQISQRLYIEDLVQKYSPEKIKGRAVPCTPDILHLASEPEEDGAMIHPKYRTLIGQLLWLTVISRPDIAFATTFLARFSARGTQECYNAALRIVAYLQVTANQCITYVRENTGRMREHIIAHSPLEEYTYSKNTMLTFTDSSHGGERPMAGYVGFLAEGPVSWSSFRLSVTPLSSCQGEYHAATKAAVMTKANSDILRFAGFPSSGAAPIFCDNRAAVLLSESDISIKKLRHVATQIAFLRELVNSEDMALIHISTVGQIADIYTKPLPAAIFHELRAHLTAPQVV